MTTGRFVLFFCPYCKRYTPTIQLDEGYVPDHIACLATGTLDNGCSGRAEEVLGDLPVGAPLTPEWEWYAPHGRSRIPASENRAVSMAASKTLVLRKRIAA